MLRSGHYHHQPQTCCLQDGAGCVTRDILACTLELPYEALLDGSGHAYDWVRHAQPLQAPSQNVSCTHVCASHGEDAMLARVHRDHPDLAIATDDDR